MNNECYHAALALSLTIPDICGKVEFKKDKVTKRYIKWYNEYVLPTIEADNMCEQDFPFQSGELIYNLRNSFLHSGEAGLEVDRIKDERNQVVRFVLYVSDANRGQSTQITYQRYGDIFRIENRRIAINVKDLCLRLAEAGKDYYQNNAEKFDEYVPEIYDIRGTSKTPQDFLEDPSIKDYELKQKEIYVR